MVILSRNFARRRYAVITILVLLAVLILAPLVPYEIVNDKLAFINQRTSAQVSVSYSLMHCGIVYNPTNTTVIGGVVTKIPIWSGARFVCLSGILEQQPAGSQSLSFERVFGENSHSMEVSLAKFPVGANVSFEGVNFLRVNFTYRSNAPTGFNITYTFKSDGFAGWSAVPYGDGNWGSITNPSTGQVAGCVVYPSKDVVDLLVKS